MSKHETKAATPAAPQLRIVPYAEILVDKNTNDRTLYTGIQELAADLKANGQLVPVIVTDNPRRGEKGAPPYFLVAGFRRMAALGMIGATDVQVSYRPGASPLDIAVARFVENEGRRNLTSYERCRAIVRMSEEFKLDAEAIAKKVASARGEEGAGGLSKNYVQNVLRLMRNLHPTILKAFESNHRAATLTYLISLASKSHEDQLASWEALTTEENDDGAPEGGEGGSGEGEGEGGKGETSRKPNKGAVADAIANAEFLLANAEKGSVEFAKADAVVKALKWAQGLRKDIPGVTAAAITRRRESAEAQD